MMNIKSQVQLRKAKPLDSKAILDLVKELALFEKAPDQVKTTESEYSDGLHSGLFQVILAEHPTLGILGMALYFPYFSTWGGKTMYLEDFIIKEEYCRYGLGSLLFEAFILDAKIKEPANSNGKFWIGTIRPNHFISSLMLKLFPVGKMEL